MSEELKCGDISDELSREYAIYGFHSRIAHIIHITKPKKVFYGKGHAFHRVWDGNEVILCPAPGFIYSDHGEIVGFCELLWTPSKSKDPCQW